MDLVGLLTSTMAPALLEFLVPAGQSVATLCRPCAGEMWVWRALLSAFVNLLTMRRLCRGARSALAPYEIPDPFLLSRIAGWCELERCVARRLDCTLLFFTEEQARACLGSRWWMQPPPALGGDLAGVAYERLLVGLVALLSRERWRGSPRCMAASLFGRDGPTDSWVSAAVHDMPAAWPAALGLPPLGAVGGFRWPDGTPRPPAVDGARVPGARVLRGASSRAALRAAARSRTPARRRGSGGRRL